VADPPEVAALEDTDGDGRADKRTRILGDFGHLDNGSLHGLIFGPDGLLYMTMGSPDGYRLARSDGTVLEGKSGALIRSRPDGSDPEVVARGFVNLVEVVFLPSGEVLGTDNWFSKPEGGIRDAIVDIAEGGLYPYLEDEGTRFPMTGLTLSAVTRFPAVALSGIALYRGTAFPAEMRGQLYCAQHNSRKVARHRLIRDGSTFRTEDFDFVESSDPDFHPSDVLEDLDGSLLVVDTGGWYVQHCPTGRIRRSMAPGGIYRVRWAGPPGPAHGASTEERPLLGDARLGDVLPGDEKGLIALLGSPSLAVRRAAAEALGRTRSKAGVRPLIALLGGDVDPHLEHTAVLAIERCGGLETLARELEWPDAHPRVQRAALVLLEVRAPDRLARGAVATRLASSDPALRRAASGIIARRADWIDEALGALRSLLARPELSAGDGRILEDLVHAFGSRPGETAELVARAIAGEEQATFAMRQVLLGAIGRLGKTEMPPAWIEALRRLLRDGPAELQLDAVLALRSSGCTDLDRELEALAASPEALPSLRLAALATAAPRLGEPSPAVFELLLARLSDATDPLSRLAAAEALVSLSPSRGQLERALPLWRADAVIPHGLFDDLRRQAVAAGVPGVPPARAVLGGEEARVRLAALEPLLAGGDAARGREVFLGSRAACSTCHRVGSEGDSVGPDLTKVGAIRAGRDLLESIVAPSSTFAQGYEPWAAVTSDGRTILGVIARQTDAVVTFRIASGAEAPVPRASIQAIERSETSIMPEGLDKLLSGRELQDLLAYLSSLR